MDRKAFEHDIQDVITDFVELIAKAFFGGLAAAVAMGLAILALSSNVQAATPIFHNPGSDSIDGRIREKEPWSVALTPRSTAMRRAWAPSGPG